MYQISFYVPASHVDSVKDALFSAGAGHYNGYDRCAWQTLGQGQFRPLPGSTPYQGSIDNVETVAEYKVELVCEAGRINQAISALLEAHPYQQPAYAVYKILTGDDFSPTSASPGT